MKGREVITRGTTLIATKKVASLDHVNGVNPKSLTKSSSVILLKSDFHLIAACSGFHHPRIALLCFQTTVSFSVLI